MIVRRRRLRVAVPEHVVTLPEQMGHGRVWRRMLRELRADAEVVAVDPFARRRPRADVWLTDAGAEAVSADVPVVTHLHEAPWVVPELRAHVSREFLAVVEPRVAASVKGAARVVTVSHSAKALIAQGLGYPAERIHVAHNGVDLETFRPGPGAGLPYPYVLFAATVQPRKNLSALREAMVLLTERGLPHRLVVVAGPAVDRADSSALETALLAELPGGLVRVERPTDAELSALMAGCAAFCLPSLWEGFGLTAVEAMACGAPVVVSDRGALPEVVGDAGLVAAPEPYALADALERVLTDRALAARLGRAGHARAQGFTWRRTADAVLRALRCALEGG